MRRMWSAVVAIAIAATPAYADDEPAFDTAATDASDGAVATDAGGRAEKGTLGLGLIFGEPTGVTAKLYLADDRAVQAAIGGSFYADAWQVHGEYVLHPWILQDRDTFVLPVYLGPGLRFMYYNEGRDGDAHVAIGLRGVIGLLFDFKQVPLDVFVEVGGVLEYDFDSGWGPGLNVGAGIRYYF
jgi:hypothetical protein